MTLLDLFGLISNGDTLNWYVIKARSGVVVAKYDGKDSIDEKYNNKKITAWFLDTKIVNNIYVFID